MQIESLCRWCRRSLAGGSCELSSPCAPHGTMLYADMLRECFGVTVRLDGGRAVCTGCADRLRESWQLRKDLLLAETGLATWDEGDGAFHEVKLEWGTVGDDIRAGGATDASPAGGGSTDDCDASHEHGEADHNTLRKEKKSRRITKSKLTDNHVSIGKLKLDKKSLSEDTFLPTEPEKKPMNTPECVISKVSFKKTTKITMAHFMKPTVNTVGTQKKRATKIFAPLSFKGITIKPKTYNLQPIRTSLDAAKDEPASTVQCNAALIIESSYACPFKYLHNQYLCFYCNRTFQEPDLLREHTKSEHSANGLRRLLRFNKLTKIDVTEVNCKLCSEKINDIDTLKLHLVKEHKKKFYADVGDGVLPFALTRDALKCALCEERFPYFHSVNQHMNEHFPNFVCETCGHGFVDRTRLQVHKSKHGRTERPCETCGRSFRGLHALREHIERFHERKGRIFCPVCPEKFLSQERKAVHMVTAHGRQPQSFECPECGRDFPSRRALTLHRRREHLRDLPHECPYCARRFFTRSGLRSHTPTHTGERPHRCDACGESFARGKALTEHARTHALAPHAASAL